MIKVSSFLLRNLIRKPQFRFCVSNVAKNINMPRIVEDQVEDPEFPEEIEEDSAFEQVVPENLTREILMKLYSAKDVEQTLQIYGTNKSRISHKNIAFIVRSIYSRFHTIYKENAEAIARNYYLKELIKYIKANLDVLNEPTLTEVLIFFRKIKENKLSDDITSADENKVLNLLNKLIEEKRINPKLCAQIFMEYVLLGKNPSVPLGFLQESFDDPNRQSYFNPYTVSLILNGITKITTERKRHLDFAYKLVVHIENGLSTFTVRQICTLFNRICFLKLNSSTSHKRNPQVLGKMKTIIEENRDSLMEEDVINVLEGYQNAPHTLDITLFKSIKNSVLLTISEKPLNLSLEFLVKFVNSMANQREGLKLSKESLTMISEELTKRYEMIAEPKLSLIVTILKGFGDHGFAPVKLYRCLYKKILSIPETKYTLNLCITIATLFLKQNFPIDEFLKRIFIKFQHEINERHVEGVFKTFYVYTHPNTPTNEFFQKAVDHIFKILLEQCQKYPVISLKILGNYYAHLRNNYYVELQRWAFDEIKSKWPTMTNYDRSNQALLFINAKYPENLWTNFFLEEFQNLKQEDLAALLSSYEYKATKTYYMADFVFKAINRSESKHQVLRKIIDAINNTPRETVITKRGGTNDEIRTLVESLVRRDLEIDKGITITDISKLNRTLKLFGVDTSLVSILAVKYLEKSDVFKSTHKDKVFNLAELSEILVETVEKSENTGKPELLAVREKAIEYLKKMHDIFLGQLEYQNIKYVALSMYIKMVENIKMVYTLDPSLKDNVFVELLMNQLVRKSRGVALDRHAGTVLNAIFFMLDCEITGFYHHEKFQLDHIAETFKGCINILSPIAILEHLSRFEKHFGNPNMQNLTKFLLIINNFYVNSIIQIYPNVIADYLRFFVKSGAKDPRVYNKVLQDIEKVFKDIRPTVMMGIMQSFSILRLKSTTLFKEFADQVQADMSHYVKDLSGILLFYGRIGFMDDWCQEFIKKGVECLEASTYDFNKHPTAAFNLLWVMGLYDIANTQLIARLSPAFEKYVLSEQWLKDDFKKELLNELYLLYKNQHPGFNEYSLSDEVIEKLEQTKLKRLVPTKQIEDVFTTLEEMGIVYEKNKSIDDLLISDIYLPNQSTGIFFLSGHYTTFDETEDSGYQIMRNKILQNYSSTMKMAKIYAYHWRKLSNPQEKQKYLQDLGIKKESNNQSANDA